MIVIQPTPEQEAGIKEITDVLFKNGLFIYSINRTKDKTLGNGYEITLLEMKKPKPTN